MNREQKAAFIDDVAARVTASDAVFAIDYRGISVPQVAELRGKLGEAGATFQVVKNTLTRLALDKADGAGKAGSVDLKEFLEGPTAFTYVTGDIALAAKAIANFAKEHELLEYKGGVMDGQVISVEQFTALTKLPSRDVLNARLVGMIASPISGVVRTLNALLSGLAIQLGQIAEQGLVGAGAEPAKETPAEEPAADAEAEAPAEGEAAETPAEAEGEPEVAAESESESEAEASEDSAESPEPPPDAESEDASSD